MIGEIINKIEKIGEIVLKGLKEIAEEISFEIFMPELLEEAEKKTFENIRLGKVNNK